MEELLSRSCDKTPKDEIIYLLATAVLRKQLQSLNKEPDRLDNSATSCMTVNTTEKTTEGDYD